MAKRVQFSDLPVVEYQAGDTVAAYRNGRVVRIPVGGGGGEMPDLATVATTGQYSDLLGKPTLGSAASMSASAFATAAQGAIAATALQPADIGVTIQAYSSVLSGTTASFTTALNDKLDDIATGATANQSDAYLLNRTNHTGQQAIDTVVGLQSALDGKADVQVVGFDRAHPDLTLTPDGRTATNNSVAGMRNALHRQPKSGGRYYFEVTINAAASISSFGLAGQNISLAANAYVHRDAWVITYTGFTNGSVVTSVSPGFAAGDTIGIAVDFDSGEMWASKNGVWLADGDPANGLNAGLANVPVGVVPIVSLYPANLAATIRLTGGDLVSAPPAGFTPWSDTPIAIDSVDGLRNELDSKADIDQLETVATTGNYNDLLNKPSIPTLPATVSQAEAEAGTATTARLWTSQRVRQNVAAFTYSKQQIDDKIDAGGSDSLTLAQAQAIALYF